MIYIYDILLNFNEVPFEFFEWQEEDSISHIKKIPLYKVKREVLEDLLYGVVLVDSSFLEEICNKTEYYQDEDVENESFLALFTDGMLSLAVKFNSDGKSILKSRLLLDEEEEVLEFSKDLSIINFNYTCLNKEKLDSSTRYERQIRSFLKQEFEKALEEDNKEKIKYFYEECFNKVYNENTVSGKEVFNSLDHVNKFHKRLYSLLKSAYHKVDN